MVEACYLTTKVITVSIITEYNQGYNKPIVSNDIYIYSLHHDFASVKITKCMKKLLWLMFIAKSCININICEYMQAEKMT